MTRKSNDTQRIATLIYDTLHQMARWGAPLTVERITDSVVMVKFQDESSSVQIRVSQKGARSDT